MLCYSLFRTGSNKELGKRFSKHNSRKLDSFDQQLIKNNLQIQRKILIGEGKHTPMIKMRLKITLRTRQNIRHQHPSLIMC